MVLFFSCVSHSLNPFPNYRGFLSIVKSVWFCQDPFPIIEPSALLPKVSGFFRTLFLIVEASSLLSKVSGFVRTPTHRSSRCCFLVFDGLFCLRYGHIYGYICSKYNSIIIFILLGIRPGSRQSNNRSDFYLFYGKGCFDQGILFKIWRIGDYTW
jgi:hypothetical protein